MRSIIAVVVLLVFSALPAGALGDDPPQGTDDDSPSAAQLAKVELLADYAAGEGADEATLLAARESVSALRDQGVGWGALFKLQRMALILGVDVTDLLGAGGESGEFDFGELKKTLPLEQLAAYEDGVKNFGQLKKAAKDKAKEGWPPGKGAKKDKIRDKDSAGEIEESFEDATEDSSTTDEA